MRYRTLLIRRKVEEIPPEQLNRFVEVQQQFRKWATEWYLSGFKTPIPEKNPLKYFARELRYALAIVPTNGPRAPRDARRVERGYPRKEQEAALALSAYRAALSIEYGELSHAYRPPV